jgi:hypothetical protein
MINMKRKETNKSSHMIDDVDFKKTMDIFDRYREAKFDCLMVFGSEDNPLWCCGFFCQGPESVGFDDGLICYLPLQNHTEKEREKHLSMMFKTAEQAIEDSYDKWRVYK